MCRTERTPPRLLLLLLLCPTETDRSNEPQGEPANLLHYIKARDPVPRKSPPPIPPPLQLIARGPNETSLSRGSLPRVHRVFSQFSSTNISLAKKEEKEKKNCVQTVIFPSLWIILESSFSYFRDFILDRIVSSTESKKNNVTFFPYFHS